MKALSLFSGGLDSILAIKLIQEQGIDVIALAFTSPFFISDEKKKKMQETAKQHRFKLKFIRLGKDYFKTIEKPKHGYGKNMNPCIDCHAFMLKKAKEYAEKIKARFIFTGDVLDERPMSQNKQSLNIVEKEAGLKGKLLRPLSAKLLPETEAEKKGFIGREKLKAIRGRGRKKQFALAKRYNLKEFESPGGGCLLTYEAYSKKMRDLFKNKKNYTEDDIKLLKIGRHFRYSKNKIIVGRNEEDNKQLLKLKAKSDYVFEAKDVTGPTTLLQDSKTKKAVEIAAAMTARYSDAEEKRIQVKYGKKSIVVDKIKDKELEKLRI